MGHGVHMKCSESTTILCTCTATSEMHACNKCVQISSVQIIPSCSAWQYRADTIWRFNWPFVIRWLWFNCYRARVSTNDRWTSILFYAIFYFLILIPARNIPTFCTLTRRNERRVWTNRFDRTILISFQSQILVPELIIRRHQVAEPHFLVPFKVASVISLGQDWSFPGRRTLVESREGVWWEEPFFRIFKGAASRKGSKYKSISANPIARS